MPNKFITPGNSFVIGPEMNSLFVIVDGGKAPVAGGLGGRIVGRATLTTGETIFTNTDNGCSGGANGTGGAGAGRAGGSTNWIGRTSSTKGNCFMIAGGGGGRVGGAGSGGGPGGHTLHTEANGSNNCTVGAAGTIGNPGGGGGGRGWQGGAGGAGSGGAAGNGTGGTNMYRSTVVDGASVTSTEGIGSTNAGLISITWSRTIVGVVSEYPIVTDYTIAACGSMI